MEDRPIKDMQRMSETTLFTSFASDGTVRSASVEIGIETARTNDMIDVTDHVRAAVAEADVTEGMTLVATPHTTCAVIVNENELGFMRDFARALERLAPEDAHYEHNDAPHDEEDEAPNGYAHIRSAFLSSPSVMLPIRENVLALGRWQRIFLVELDRSRPRRLQITVLGRAG